MACNRIIYVLLGYQGKNCIFKENQPYMNYQEAKKMREYYSHLIGTPFDIPELPYGVIGYLIISSESVDYRKVLEAYIQNDFNNEVALAICGVLNNTDLSVILVASSQGFWCPLEINEYLKRVR